MKTFKIGVWEEQGGYIYIKAKNKKEAIEEAQLYIDENGLDYREDAKYRIDQTHRDIDVFIGDVTEVRG